ncbi:MAG: hypothetical protein HYY52_08170 [Candidatus Melainabacteria bacterium]|nr:hypothetical protein [Candidatus Melainabacteria bacterium]
MQNNLNAILDELAKQGMGKPEIMERASIKLKLLALKNSDDIDQNKINEIIKNMREFAALTKTEANHNIKITKFGVDERGSDYHYEVKSHGELLGKIKVTSSGGPTFWNSATQKSLNNAMDKVNETGNWEDFDNALKEIADNKLPIYFED